MADPVSWLLIEPGWQVDAADAQATARVEEVLGDSSSDIFDGLSISGGTLGHPAYVAAEQVAEIVEGRVRLSLTNAQIDRLGESDEPPGQDTERVGLVRRALEWLGVAGRR
jgi:hypothetical protein